MALPEKTLNHKFAFLGQRWRFLRHEFERDGTDTFDRHATIKSAIAGIERRSVDTRILENFEGKVNSALQGKKSDHDSVGIENGDLFDLEAELSISFDEDMTKKDAQELATSLNNLRIFYGQQDLNQAKKQTHQVGVAASPRLPAPVLQAQASSKNEVSTPKRPNELGRPSKSGGVTKSRGLRQAVAIDRIRESKKNKSNLTEEKDPSQLNASARAKRLASFATKSNLVGGNQSINARLAATHSKLHQIYVGKQFKAYIEDHGLRVPHFLAGIETAATPPSSDAVA